jgi:hypothetical protein
VLGQVILLAVALLCAACIVSALYIVVEAVAKALLEKRD